MCSVAHGKGAPVLIRPINTDAQLEAGLAVIRTAFATVAEEFGLSIDNCPTHPSFITLAGLRKIKNAGAVLFGLYVGDIQAGLVAIEKSEGGLYYIEKLSVLPPYRHAGHGGRLLRFAFEWIAERKGTKISIGIIDEHAVLKRWYETFGFTETGKKSYAHLPFTVCFMEKSL